MCIRDSIDTLQNQLVLQNPPNDGILMTIGNLGVDFDTLGGFDILADGMGGNSGFAVSNDALYKVDLNSGAAIKVRSLGLGSMSNLQGFTILSNSAMGMENMGMDNMEMKSGEMSGMETTMTREQEFSSEAVRGLW